MTQGMALIDAGRIAEAVEFFRLQRRLAIDQGQTVPADGWLKYIGVAYLAAGDSIQAKLIFDDLVSRNPSFMDSYYAYAGVARWCLDKAEDAISVWRGGLECAYRDPAGGIELPLLLHFSAVRRPEFYGLSAARDLLGDRLGSPLSKNWPGPIARFLLGEIDEQELMCLARSNHQLVSARRVAQAIFHVGIVAFERGDMSAYMSKMEWCSTRSVEHLRYERFLAVHEISGGRQGTVPSGK